MPPPKKLRDVLRAEKQNRKHLAEAVLAALLLLGPGRVAVAALTPRIFSALRDVHQRGQSLASRHALELPRASSGPHDVQQASASQTAAESLALDAAAGALAVLLVRSTAARSLSAEAESFHSVAREAARDNLKRIGLTADTEFYRAYNDRFSEAVSRTHPTATLVWVAVLDKHTCSECESLDGTTAPASEGFKTNPPLHPRCRCVLDVAQ